MKVFKNLIFSFLFFLLLFFSLMLIGEKVFLFSFSSYVVLSGSMSPAISPGDIIIAKRVPFENLQKGDIIIFYDPQSQGKKITHRIFEKKIFSVKTKGDANSNQDAWEVGNASILGRVVLTIPKIGYLVSFAKTLPGFLTLIFFPGLFLILSEFYSLVSYVKKLEKNSQKKEKSFSFSPKIFFLTVFLGFFAEIMMGSAYAVFSSSAKVGENFFSTGYWLTPSPEFLTSTPSPSLAITFTATPSPTLTPTSFFTLTPTVTETPTSTVTPTVTSTVTPTGMLILTETPTPSFTPTPTVSSSPTIVPGLVAYWKIEEGQNQYVYDSSGNGHTLLFRGNEFPQWSNEVPSGNTLGSTKSLYFNGENYLALFSSEQLSNFDFSSGFTFEAWLKTDVIVPQDTNMGIVSKWNEGGGYIMWLHASYIKNYINDGSVVKELPSQTVIADNTWHYVVVTWDGSTQKVYVDGNKEGEQLCDFAPLSIRREFRIGAYEAQGQYKGYLDEIKIYNYARSQEEIQEDAGFLSPTPSLTPTSSPTPTISQELVAYWKMEEGTGNLLQDSSSHNYALTLKGDPLPFWTNDLPPTSNETYYSLYFDGNNYGQLEDGSTAFDFLSGFTIESWVKPDFSGVQDDGRGIISKWGENNGWMMRFSGNTSTKVSNTINGSTLLSASSLIEGQWQHLAMVWDGTKLSFYLNGKKEGFLATSQFPNSLGKVLYLATYFPPDHNFKGYLDELKIYNYARSQEEIQEDAGFLSPTPSLTPTSSPTPTFSPTPTTTPPVLGPLINEFLPHPSAEGNEWVEFYNPTATNLTSYFLDDDLDFTSDSGNMPIKSLNNLNQESSFFPYFELSQSYFNNSGDYVVLFSPGGEIIDSYQFTEDPGENVSLGRKEDGGGWGKCLSPSKGESNNDRC